MNCRKVTPQKPLNHLKVTPQKPLNHLKVIPQVIIFYLFITSGLTCRIPLQGGSGGDVEFVQPAWLKTARSVHFIVTNLSIEERGKRRKAALNEGASVLSRNPPSPRNSLQHRMLQMSKRSFQDSQLQLHKKVAACFHQTRVYYKHLLSVLKG